MKRYVRWTDYADVALAIAGTLLAVGFVYAMLKAFGPII